MHAHTCTGWLSRTPTLDTCGIKASVEVLAISNKKAAHGRPRIAFRGLPFVTNCEKSKSSSRTTILWCNVLAFFTHSRLPLLTPSLVLCPQLSAELKWHLSFTVSSSHRRFSVTFSCHGSRLFFFSFLTMILSRLFYSWKYTTVDSKCRVEKGRRGLRRRVRRNFMLHTRPIPLMCFGVRLCWSVCLVVWWVRKSEFVRWSHFESCSYGYIPFLSHMSACDIHK